MAAISSGVAASAVSSITETRFCISDHLRCFGAPLAGGRSPLLRTPLPRSDTASRIYFEDFVVRRPERTVQALVADLEAAGYLIRTRAGRRTMYAVNQESLFRHPAQD